MLQYGLVRNLNGPKPYEWDVFRGLADLTKKSDESMDEYLKKLLKISEEVIYLHEGGPKPTQGNVTANGTPTPSENGLPEDSETLTYDRAKKIMRRIDYFYKLREVVIFDPDVSFFNTS